MSDVKTFCFPEGGTFGGNGMEGMLLGSMMNGGMGGNGMWNNPIWAIVFLAALRNGGLFGNDGCGNGYHSQLSQIQDTLNTNQGNTLLMDAIKGNATSIGQLASTLNCNYNAVQGAINAVQSAICNLGNQYGLGNAQVINAINSGNMQMINTLQSCCCDVKQLVTTQGYENRINNIEQTNTITKGFGDVQNATQMQTTALAANADANAREITGKIDAQTTLINDKFCQLELRGLQDKLDQERAKNLALTNQISQEHQNATIAAMISPLKSEVDEIKCKLPSSVTIPYSPVVGVPSCVAWNAGLYGLTGGQFGLNGGIFG